MIEMKDRNFGEKLNNYHPTRRQSKEDEKLLEETFTKLFELLDNIYGEYKV